MEKNFLSHGFFSIFFSPFSSPPFHRCGLTGKTDRGCTIWEKGVCMYVFFILCTYVEQGNAIKIFFFWAEQQ